MTTLRMPDHWVFDYAEACYLATVRARFTLPVYSHPYPRGSRLGWSYLPGQRFQFYDHVRTSDYISVRVDDGWVNVWTRYNNRGNSVGVIFADIEKRPCDTLRHRRSSADVCTRGTFSRHITSRNLSPDTSERSAAADGRGDKSRRIQ